MRVRRRRRPSPSSTGQQQAAADGPTDEHVGRRPGILDSYVHEAPSAQLAVDVFSGEWSSSLPPEVGATAGAIALWNDSRIDWIVEQAGGVEGKAVLELGPLEACHSYMLERAGADVTAIEGNSRAYLKCLIVKELVPLRRARFLLGDFLAHLEATADKYDLVVASGVLYHAPDPLRLLRAIGRVADSVGIWTHYFDEQMYAHNDGFHRVFGEPFKQPFDGGEVTLHRRHYLESLEFQGFCGGAEESAVWMQLDDIVAVLRSLGFVDIQIGNNDMLHPHGPCVLLYASR
ncbi:MAG: methyltransferase domain-containing protein [Ilumatobacteraceae bacterium]